MFGGKEPYIYTGGDEGYDKYDLTADDLAVLISPTKSPGQPMVSPHASYGSDPQGSAGSSSVENFFFDINDLPSLGSEDQHFFGNSPAVVQREAAVDAVKSSPAETASMHPPLPHHPKMPGSKEKKGSKQAKPKRKSVFSFDLNEVNKFSNGQATPVIKTDASAPGAPAAAIPVMPPSSSEVPPTGGAVSAHHQQHPSLTDSYISFNLGVTPSDAGTLPSLSSLGYVPPGGAIGEPPTAAYFQDASVILNKPPSHRSRNSSANNSGQQKSFSPSELQDLSGNGELREPKGLHIRGRAIGITPLATEQVNAQYSQYAQQPQLQYQQHPHHQLQQPQQQQQQQQQQHAQVHPNYVTAYRSPKNVLDALTAEDIADLEFLRIDFSDPLPDNQSEDYYYSSEGNTGGSHSTASAFSPQSDVNSPNFSVNGGSSNSSRNMYYGLNMSSVMGPGRTHGGSSSGPPSTSSRRSGSRIKLQEPELKESTGSGKSSRGRKSSSNTPQPLTPTTPVDEEKTSKSLSAISRRFIEFYGGTSTIDYISGLCNPEDYDDNPEQVARVDGAAETLGVHVRRIYELIKILEILSLVTFSGGKRGKFTWRGTKFFMLTLGSMQSEGMLKYPEVASMSGLKQMDYVMPTVPNPLPPSNMRSLLKKDNSLQDDALSVPHNADLPAGGFDLLQGDFGAQSVRSSNNSLKGLDHPVEATHTNPIGLLNDSDFESGDEFIGGHYHSGVAELTDLTSTDFSGGQHSSNNSSSNLHDVAAAAAAGVTYGSGYSSEGIANTVAASVGYAGKPPTAKVLSRNVSSGSVTGEHEDVMMESICKSFLQLFLVGLDGISMGYAIQQIIPKDENQTLQEYNKKNATKIRRVYDVANVLCSVNLIKKQSQVSKFKKTDSKSDSKALMWSSFPPLVVRDYYLRHSHQLSHRHLHDNDD